MPTQEDRERERIAKLRNQQINSRDPGPSKIRHYDWSKQKKQKTKPILVEIFEVVPTRWRGLVLGVIGGLLVMAILLIAAPTMAAISIIFPILGAVIGYMSGVSIQK